MIVMKFGGSSLESAERFRETSKIITHKVSDEPVVVVSAIGGITNKLVNLHENAYSGRNVDASEIKRKHWTILQELNLSPTLLDPEFEKFEQTLAAVVNNKRHYYKSLDEVISFGERMSSKILSEYLNKKGYKAQNYNAYDIGMITDSNFGNAEPLPEAYENIKYEIGNVNCIPVITGFLGKDINGYVTTLGRGGSDYTAALIGAAIEADAIEIWTDVDGIMTTDPRIKPTAKSVPLILFNEAAESAYFGAKVLHPKTIVPAVKKNIPVKVLNSFNPEHPGTTIVNTCDICENIVRVISNKNNVTVLNIDSTRMLNAYGFLKKLFEVFGKYKIPVDMIATSEVSVSMTIEGDVEDELLRKVYHDLREIGDVGVEKNKSIICLVGNGMKNAPGIGARIFTALSKESINVEMISHGASKVNMGFVVDQSQAKKAICALHKEFFE